MQYGPALAGVEPAHPILRIVDATLAAFRERGIPTVLFVLPANVAHLADLGVMGGTGFDTSLARIAEVATARGAHFADLHAAFPDEVFTDATGHFGVRHGSDGASRLADLLANPIQHFRS